MKKIILFLILSIALSGTNSTAQCTSGITTYDLIISDSTINHPSSTSFVSAIVCTGGVFVDSASCCTRMIHIMPGAFYEARGMAYGMAYVKAGGTFNANNSALWFSVAYEAGATILNYTGPMTLCATIIFNDAPCLSIGVEENTLTESFALFPNPASNTLSIQHAEKYSAIELFDIAGKKVYSTVITADINIDISAVPDGVYCYELTSKSGLKHRGRLVVIK